MTEKRDEDMAVNKKEDLKSTTVSNKTAITAAQKVMGKYKKAFEKLSKN